MKVHFEQVGRRKSNWTVETARNVTDRWLISQVRNSGAVMSRDIDVVVTPDGMGKVYAGMQVVGSVRFED